MSALTAAGHGSSRRNTGDVSADEYAAIGAATDANHSGDSSKRQDTGNVSADEYAAFLAENEATHAGDPPQILLGIVDGRSSIGVEP
jgi:hypothetical protein